MAPRSPSTGAEPAPTTQALERGLALLTLLAEQRGPVGLVELARGLGLSKSTCHRYLASLVAAGYADQEVESRRYQLGPRAVGLGLAAVTSLELTRVAAPLLQSLADETNHAASMAILDGVDVVYVARHRPARAGYRIELSVQVGTRLPAYCTAMGKVLLAHRDPDVVRTVLDRVDLARRGPRTITAREELVAELRRVAHSGLAVNDEELAPGLRSLACPVRDSSGLVVAAINVAVPLSAWSASLEAVVSRLEAPLRGAAREISRRLGHL